jgi:hypothetical protein
METYCFRQSRTTSYKSISPKLLSAAGSLHASASNSSCKLSQLVTTTESLLATAAFHDRGPILVHDDVVVCVHFDV